MAVILMAAIAFNVVRLKHNQAEDGIVTATVRYAPIDEVIGGYGCIASFKTINVSVYTPVPVAVDQVWVAAGEAVSRHQKLIRLDTVKLQQKLDREKGEYEKLEADRRVFEETCRREAQKLKMKIDKIKVEWTALQKTHVIRQKEYETAKTLRAAHHINTIELDEAAAAFSASGAEIHNKEYELQAAIYDLELLPFQNAVEKARIENDLRDAENDMATLEGYISGSTVVSPVNGVISDIKVLEGDRVSGITSLLSIADRSHWCFNAQISSEKAPLIHPDTSFRVTLDDYFYREIKGERLMVESTVSKDTNTFNIYAFCEFPDDMPLKLGMKGFIRLTSSRTSLSVPSAAIMNPAGQPSVFVVQNQRVRLTPIETGLMAGGRTEVRKGLQPDDEVVVHGKENLHDGDILDAGRHSASD
jgi:multidrug efflux pump subunit AcrA (membrane-fusion protein)